MIVRIVISMVVAALAAVAFIPTARHMADVLAALPAVSEVSLCHAFDTPQKRARFVRQTAGVAAGIFGGVTLVALGSVWFVRKRKMAGSRDFVPAAQDR